MLREPMIPATPAVISDSPLPAAFDALPAVALSQLPTGARAVVASVDLPASDLARLEALGLTRESEIRVCRAGKRCIVQVRGTRVALSSDYARHLYARQLAAIGA